MMNYNPPTTNGGAPNVVDPNSNPPGGFIPPIIDIVPIELLTASARATMKQNAWWLGLKRAAAKNVVNSDFSNAIIREIRPTADLNFGANANQDWLSTALVSGTYNAIVNNFQVPVNKLLVIYGMSTFEPNPSIGEIQLARGTGGSGGVNTIINLQQLYQMLEFEVFFSKGILYDPQDIVYWSALPFKANALGERYVFHGYVIETVGTTIAAQPN